jgi:hypothetical protein
MTTNPLASIGIDIGKEVFHVIGFGTDGKIAFRRKIKRLALLEAFKLLPPSIVGMEACLSAHESARMMQRPSKEGNEGAATQFSTASPPSKPPS